MMQTVNKILHIGGVILPILFFSFPCWTYSQEINIKALFNVPKEYAVSASSSVMPHDERQRRNMGAVPNMDTSLMDELVHRALYDTTGVILFKEEELPPADMPDSVYIRRLAAMPSIISLPYNDIVRSYIVYYMQKYPRHSGKMVGLAEYYLPKFEEILDAYNIPLEMKALPIIESSLNPIAVSRAGATGMWQFMLVTGRRYGLTINTYVDERRDPITSTYAAAKYLTVLYSMFHDWTLALAAYNCGEGNVLKAISRAGGKRDYWEIYPYLPKETRNYVPLFVAANYAITYYKEHRITPGSFNFPTQVDTFMVNSKLHFEQIANTIDIPIVKLRELNPQYRHDVIPGNERPYELRIPSEYTNAFIDNERRIYGHNEAKYFNPNIVVNPTTSPKNGKSTTTTSIMTSNSPQTIHEVTSGESLGLIASRYKIKLNDLYSWNSLTERSTIYPGQKLVIYGKHAAVTSSDNNRVKSPSDDNRVNPPSDDNRVKSSSDDNRVKPPSDDNRVKSPSDDKHHIVESGDNFWAISKKYNVNIDRLLELNNMTRDSKLFPGKKLLLPTNKIN
jgi:membrane-bound lytic murein transglycosylase D